MCSSSYAYFDAYQVYVLPHILGSTHFNRTYRQKVYRHVWNCVAHRDERTAKCRRDGFSVRQIVCNTGTTKNTPRRNCVAHRDANHNRQHKNRIPSPFWPPGCGWNCVEHRDSCSSNYFFIASYWRTTSFASSLSASSPLTSVNTRPGPPCAIISWIFTASSSSA